MICFKHVVQRKPCVCPDDSLEHRVARAHEALKLYDMAWRNRMTKPPRRCRISRNKPK